MSFRHGRGTPYKRGMGDDRGAGNLRGCSQVRPAAYLLYFVAGLIESHCPLPPAPSPSPFPSAACRARDWECGLSLIFIATHLFALSSPAPTPPVAGGRPRLGVRPAPAPGGVRGGGWVVGGWGRGVGRAKVYVMRACEMESEGGRRWVEAPTPHQPVSNFLHDAYNCRAAARRPGGIGGRQELGGGVRHITDAIMCRFNDKYINVYAVP